MQRETSCLSVCLCLQAISLSVCLSVCKLYPCLSVCLPAGHIPVCLSLCSRVGGARGGSAGPLGWCSSPPKCHRNRVCKHDIAGLQLHWGWGSEASCEGSRPGFLIRCPTRDRVYPVPTLMWNVQLHTGQSGRRAFLSNTRLRCAVVRAVAV